MSSFNLNLDAIDLAAVSTPIATGTSTRALSPVCVLVIGMAGSGKSSLMQRINLEMIERKSKAYYINLDPATSSATELPFAASIDIRDTVQYKEVMKQYGLGPNGAILTSLNLFATRFDQVIRLIENKAKAEARVASEDDKTIIESGLDYVFIDTPGQIEVFTWSAGGQIIHELLASSFPTVILYVVDTPRCVSPTTFMSNMLYACSVLYKSQLPLICAFNKTDVVGCEFALEWMADFESYQEAVDADDEEYMGPFNRSLSLIMDEFYANIRSVGVSAVTGEGCEALFEKIAEAAVEFNETFVPELQRKMAERSEKEARVHEATIQRLREDLKRSKGDLSVEEAEKRKY